MIRRIASIFLAFGLALTIASSAGAQPGGGNCPDGGNKTDTNDAEIVISAGISLCVKQSNGNTGILTADGSTTLGGYAEAAGLGYGVSNYVVYETEATPSPTPTPTPTPTATPTPTPTETASPSPSASLTESPSASATPTIETPVEPDLPSTAMNQGETLLLGLGLFFILMGLLFLMGRTRRGF